jgi:hypothetical protein
MQHLVLIEHSLGAFANPMTTILQEEFTAAIKSRLWKNKITITAFAERIGYARNTVSQAINHPNYYPLVRAKIEREMRSLKK